MISVMPLFVYVPVPANGPRLEVIMHLEHDITGVDQNWQPRRTQDGPTKEHVDGAAWRSANVAAVQMLRAYNELYPYGLPPIESWPDHYTTTRLRNLISHSLPRYGYPTVLLER